MKNQSEKINILIVEDESIIALSIKKMLTDLGYNVIGIAMRAIDAIEILNKENIDIAIIDIHLKGEETGLWLGEKISKHYGIPFIYLTSFGDKSTVNDAKLTRPYGYLLKPVGKEDLYAAIETAIIQFGNDNGVENGKDTSTDKLVIKDALFVRDEYIFVKISFDDLIYIKGSGNYIEIVTGNKKRLIKGSLKTMEDTLPKSRFFSPHRSYLVNIDRIETIGNNFINVDQHKIPLVKSNKELLINAIEFYNAGKDF